jgi:hypothetical protein
MMSDTELLQQIAPYQSWLIIAGVFVLFLLLRITRKNLRRRVDEIGYRLFRERGLLIWFWLNAPGVILHEMSHAVIVLFFTPFGFRITNVTLFRIKPMAAKSNGGRVVRNDGRQALQLGEVQYVRPQGRLISYIGDGISGIAPLFGGIAAFALLYWATTGYNLWDIPIDVHQRLQLMRPGWPWWTLTFAPYLILTVTSELWPSRQDWLGARRFVIMLVFLLIIALGVLWYLKHIQQVLDTTTFVASHINFALLVLLILDLAFLTVAEIIVRIVRGGG